MALCGTEVLYYMMYVDTGSRGVTYCVVLCLYVWDVCVCVCTVCMCVDTISVLCVTRCNVCS